MKKTILNIAVCALLATPALSRAQNSTMPPAASAPLPPPPLVTAPEALPPDETNAPAKPKKPRTTLSVTGKASSVDTNAMTLTVGKRTYDITSETRITKGGKPAVLSDIAVDDKVSVSYKKSGDKFDAVSVTETKKSEKASGEKKDAAAPK